MENRPKNNRSVWARTSVTVRLTALAVAILGFLLLFFLEYTYGNKRGDVIGSIIYALPAPLWLGLGILFFSAGIGEVREKRKRWYKQSLFMNGLAFCFFPLIWLVLLGMVNNIIPAPLGFTLEGIIFVLIVGCLIWSVVLSNTKRVR
jgi:amino acid transporter